ncbi:MAG: hypothetical protein WC748_06185 [Legionellales bacterium]|jgi:hypothetical protein
MQRFKKIVFSLLLILSANVWAAPITQEQIPPVLQPWENWVLYDETQYHCPFLYDQQTSRFCAWPSTVTLDVQFNKIYFTQNWQVFAPSLVALPGDLNLWPQQVQVNGEYYPITEHNQTPMMALDPGVYTIQGVLSYGETLPEFIKIPKQTGLVALTQDNKSIAHPRFDETGQLWLQQADAKLGNAALALRVFRKINQGVPLTVQSVIELDVSGPAREVQLGPVLLPGTLAMRLDSSLPAQLDDKGILRVQLRPGKWQIEISERFPEKVDTLTRSEVGPPWPAEEIWSFEPDPQLGIMSVSGVPSVDPSQTLLPDDWRNLPAYRVLVADPVLLTSSDNIQASNNQFSLTRHMWLDFSGKSWTVEDTLQGQILSTGRLSLKQPYLLGQFNLNGQPQLITILENAQGTQIPGVEVRQGFLNAQALSVVENKWRLNATGWEENFDHVSTTLSLPPGWELLTAFGVDQIAGSVLSTWSLWDIFIVLLLTLALATVLDKKWALMAFFVLLMSYHPKAAPLLFWLNIVLALWAVQWFKGLRFLKIYRDLSFVVLAVMIVWLGSVSLIDSLYPQVIAKAQPVHAEKMLMEARPRTLAAAADQFAVPVDAKTQTGPARPQWEATQINMEWSSPVNKDQNIYLFLLSPLMLLVLTLLKIIFSIAIGLRLWKKRAEKLHMKFNFMPALAILFLSTSPDFAQANDIPDPALLDTLKTRLLEPASCLPQCASIGAAFVNVPHDDIYISLQIDALEPVAVPIPGRSAYWQADQIFVNQQPAKGLFWQDNTLMVQLDEGHHTVMIYGRAFNMDKVSLDFPLNPHWVEVTAPAWFVEGLDNHRLTGNTLDLLRRERGTQNQSVSAIQPFVRVIRNLNLGLKGEVTTQVERIAPVAGAIQLNIPLLAHESVTTPGMIVQNNEVQVSFAPHQREVTWESTLADYDDLTLLAPETTSWIEEWRVNIASIWHPSITGIPSELLQWQPWPSQSVHIQLNRLPAMLGSTVTLDQVNLLTNATTRGSEIILQALLRSTLGSQQTLKLPSDVTVKEVKVNGVLQVLQNNNEIILPISPGNNWVDIVLQTKQSAGFFTRTPKLDWGIPAYNINLGLNLPNDRFVLALGGQGYGPALLYWIWVVGAIILALVLGKMANSPLKTSQWLILLTGLSLLTPHLGLWVVVALVLCSLYPKFIRNIPKKLKRIVQALLVIILIAALGILIFAMIQGLHYAPNMQLIPSALTSQLHADFVWLQDISTKTWPRAWIISLPMWVYRGLMLLWSLWVVMSAIQLIHAVNKKNIIH